MRRRRWIALPCLLLAWAAALPAEPEPLTRWTEGSLDIHQIATGRGNAAFMIFPDGTTLLLDAGDAGNAIPYATALPDDSRRAGEWIARYIQRALEGIRPAELDYALLTHFHGDHMGRFAEDLPQSAFGDYRLSGITEVAEHVPIRKMIDRGWPDYAYPIPLNFPAVDNYRRFLKARAERDGMKTERFQPGRNDQIAPVRSPPSAAFEVRNLAVNGEVWTGVGSEVRRHFPELATLYRDDYPTENMCSLALRVSYGPFDYYAGGDQPGVVDAGGPSWNDVETPIARAIGPVDAMLVNHHGSIDPASPFFLSELRPRVIVIPAWAAGHPAPGVLRRLLSERVYPGPRGVFATRLLEPTAAVIGRRTEQLKSRQSHILIRVEPDGVSYRVLILDASSEKFDVIAVHGPYRP